MNPAPDQQATAGAMPQDATAGADPTAMAGTDPTATTGMDGMDTTAMDDGTEDMGAEAQDGDTQELLDKWESLDVEDKAAALKYIESMVDDNEEVDNAEDEAGMNDEEGADMDATGGMDATAQMPQQQPMAESVTFSKRQLKKLNEMRRLMK